MALGIEVGLSPGNFVLDGDPAPLPKKEAEPPPQFSAHVRAFGSAEKKLNGLSLHTAIFLQLYKMLL